MKKESLESLIKFYSNYRTYIFPAAVAISSIFLIMFVIYPQLFKLIANRQAIGDLTNKSKFLEAKAAVLENYDEGDLSRKVGYVLASLPTDKDYASILGLLQQLTVQSGFSLDSISFTNSVAKFGNSDSFEVRLEIKGAKSSFQTLLDNLENSPRLLKVGSIDISSSPASQSVDATLSVRVLYSSVPQNFGSADSPLPELSQKDEALITKLTRTAEPALSPSVGEPASRGKSNPFE